MARSEKQNRSKSVFIAMCFEEHLTHVYHRVVKPVLESFGFSCLRADEISAPGIILEQINEAIRASDLILCDLTFENPNVLFELGLAYALEKPIIMISQQPSSVPFDVRHMRILMYEDTKLGLLDFREELGPFLLSLYPRAPKTSPAATVLREFRVTKDNLREQQEALLSPSPQLRRYAIKFLGDFKDTTSYGTIARIATMDENADLVRDAFTAIHKINPQEALEVLVEAGLRHQKEFLVREHVVRILGFYPATNALWDQMIAQGRDSSWGVRRSVCEVMGKWGGTKASNFLQTMLSDPEPSVRFAAREAIQRLPDVAKRRRAPRDSSRDASGDEKQTG